MGVILPEVSKVVIPISTAINNGGARHCPHVLSSPTPGVVQAV